jgi:hypothetical protein
VAELGRVVAMEQFYLTHPPFHMPVASASTPPYDRYHLGALIMSEFGEFADISASFQTYDVRRPLFLEQICTALSFAIGEFPCSL